MFGLPEKLVVRFLALVAQGIGYVIVAIVEGREWRRICRRGGKVSTDSKMVTIGSAVIGAILLALLGSGIIVLWMSSAT